MNITDHLQEKKYVAFLDVLGFKELVRQKGERLNSYFETIHTALNDIELDKAEITSQLVSDSIILACDFSNDNLRLLLKAVQTIQSRCALKNIWIRGAITIGDIHFDRKLNVVVGNGLTDSYLLESQEKFPRIIIDPKVLSLENGFGSRAKFIKEFNKVDNRDGIPLIHESYSENETIETDAIFVSFAERLISQGVDSIQSIYENIQKELYFNQKNYPKYLWLKQYFIEVLFRKANHIESFQREINVSENFNIAKLRSYHNKFLNL